MADGCRRAGPAESPSALLPAAGTNHTTIIRTRQRLGSAVVRVSRIWCKSSTIQLIRVLPGAGAYAVVATARHLDTVVPKIRSRK